MKNLFTIFSCSLILGSACFISCQDSSALCLEIKFNPMYAVPDSSWFKIDDYTFVHTAHDFEWNSNKFFPNENGTGEFSYVPSTHVFYYHPRNSEKRVSEKMNSFEIGKRIGKKIAAISKDDELVYEFVNPKEYLINSTIQIKRTDGKKIRFSKSEDNPASLVMKRKE